MFNGKGRAAMGDARQRNSKEHFAYSSGCAGPGFTMLSTLAKILHCNLLRIAHSVSRS